MPQVATQTVIESPNGLSVVPAITCDTTAEHLARLADCGLLEDFLEQVLGTWDLRPPPAAPHSSNHQTPDQRPILSCVFALLRS